MAVNSGSGDCQSGVNRNDIIQGYIPIPAQLQTVKKLTPVFGNVQKDFINGKLWSSKSTDLKSKGNSCALSNEDYLMQEHEPSASLP